MGGQPATAPYLEGMSAQDPFAQAMGTKRGAIRPPLPTRLIFSSGYAARLIGPGESYGSESALTNSGPKILVEFYDSEKEGSGRQPDFGLPLATLEIQELRAEMDHGGQELRDHSDTARVQILDADNGHDLYMHNWEGFWTEAIPRDDVLSILNLQLESVS